MPFLRSLALCVGLLCCGLAQAASVVFLNPGRSDEPFWRSYADFMQAAADDLGMDLRIEFAERDNARMLRQARAILQGPEAQRPDYLVFVNEQYAAPEILRLGQGSGVRLFTVNSTLTDEQRELTGGPRERYSNWIGSLVPNDEEAGALMAEELIRQQRRLQPQGTIEMLAFSGVKQTPAARFREAGLRRVLAANPDVRLRQLVYAEWDRGRAFEQASQLLPRYPRVSLIWAANDEMAFGAMRAADALGPLVRGRLHVSALNNSPEVLQARIDGRVDVLVGGHFTLGGWALVMLADYDAGLDFARYGGVDQHARLFTRLDVQQARRLLAHIRQPGYGVRFRDFGAWGNPGFSGYRFSLAPLLD